MPRPDKVPTKKLVYDLKRQFEASFSAKNTDIPLVDLVAYLNDAQVIWFKNLVRLADSEKEISEELRVFEKKDVCLKCKVKEPCVDENYKMTVCEYPKNFYSRLSQRAITCHECCPDDKVIPINMLGPDDKNYSRIDTYRKSDFRFEQLIGDDGEEGLYIYNDDVEVKEVIIDYYRKPCELHAPSLVEECDDDEGRYYDYCGKVIKRDTNLEVTCRFSDITIVSIALLLLQKAHGKVTNFNMDLQNLLQYKNYT